MNMDINGNGNIQVGESLYLTVNGTPPAEGHPNGMYCPQCNMWTWRCSKECCRCHYDLASHLALTQLEVARSKLIRKSYVALSVSASAELLAIEFSSISLYAWCVGFFALIAGSFFSNQAASLK